MSEEQGKNKSISVDNMDVDFLLNEAYTNAKFAAKMDRDGYELEAIKAAKFAANLATVAQAIVMRRSEGTNEQ